MSVLKSVLGIWMMCMFAKIFHHKKWITKNKFLFTNNAVQNSIKFFYICAEHICFQGKYDDDDGIGLIHVNYRELSWVSKS